MRSAGTTRRASYSRSLALVLIPTALGTALGFVREITVGFYFGATAAADALAVAIYLCDTTWSFFFQVGLAYAVVPVAAAVRASGDTRAERQLLTGLLGWVAVTAVVVLGGLTFGREWFADSMFAGRPTEDRHLLSVALGISAPGFALVAVAGALACVLQAYERYGPPPLGRVGWNALAITAISAAPAALRFPAALWGLVAGAAVQVGFAWRALPRRPEPPGESSFTSLPVREVLRKSVPAFLGLGAISLALGLGERSFLGRLEPGSVAVANYALRTVNLASMVALAFFTVGFAQAALEQANGERAAVAGSVLGTVRRGLFVLAPLAAVIYVLAEPTVSLLFGRGAFTEDAVRSTAACLRIYALSVVPGFLLGIFARALFVAGREWAAVAANGFVTLVALSWDGAALSRLGVLAIPGGYALGFAIAAGFAAVVLRRTIGFGHGFAGALVPLGLAGGLAVIATHVVPVGRLLAPWRGPWWQLLGLFGAGSVLLGGYAVLAAVLHIPELGSAWGHLRRMINLVRGLA
jgi:putative peptidoglycan lipid II flippase